MENTPLLNPPMLGMPNNSLQKLCIMPITQLNIVMGTPARTYSTPFPALISSLARENGDPLMIQVLAPSPLTQPTIFRPVSVLCSDFLSMQVFFQGLLHILLLKKPIMGKKVYMVSGVPRIKFVKIYSKSVLHVLVYTTFPGVSSCLF